MRSALVRAAGLLVLAAALAGCAGTVGGVGGSGENSQVAGRPGVEVALTPATCWSGDLLGADPQETLKLSGELGVSYFAAARAIADRPAFTTTESCDRAHHVEVYRVVRVPSLTAGLTSYAALLRTDRPFYAQLERSVRNACQSPALATAVALSGVPGATMEPALPDTMTVGWAPPSPDQFARGQRVFACTLSHRRPSQVMYADVFRRRFPTALRTCIDSESLAYVDCARKHDRERIAVIQARNAVLAGAFPGPRAIKRGVHGRYVDVAPPAYAALDRACTRYLRAVSSGTRLTGVAEIDVDAWPAADGSYPIACEADTRPDKTPVVTTSSAYNR